MKIPAVTLGATLSLDGKIIETPHCEILHLRKKFDAVLTGDSMWLRADFQAEGLRGRGKETRDVSSVVFVTKSMPTAEQEALKQSKCRSIVSRGAKINLRQALEILARDYEVRTVVCEGEAALFYALLKQNLVQMLHVTFIPMVMGGAHAATLLGPASTALLPHSMELQLESFRKKGDKAFAIYRVKGGPK